VAVNTVTLTGDDIFIPVTGGISQVPVPPGSALRPEVSCVFATSHQSQAQKCSAKIKAANDALFQLQPRRKIICPASGSLIRFYLEELTEDPSKTHHLIIMSFLLQRIKGSQDAIVLK
jgi:hypothetical protein